jgi:hypothetical protein
LELQIYFEKSSRGAPARVLESGMRMTPDRAVLTVNKQAGVWCVEHEGEHFGHSPDKDEANAAAHRRAREMLDRGKPCQVRVYGETGSWKV